MTAIATMARTTHRAPHPLTARGRRTAAMEFKLDKRYALPVTVDAAWRLLSDLPATAACLPGAAITERIDERRHKGVMKAKVGPATMNFAGEVELLELDAGAHRVRMLGKGADKAGSSASMQLAARLEPGDTAGTSLLLGEATVVVSGKLAQFGNRLLVPVSDALLAQFVANFAAAAAQAPAEPDDAPRTATSHRWSNPATTLCRHVPTFRRREPTRRAWTPTPRPAPPAEALRRRPRPTRRAPPPRPRRRFDRARTRSPPRPN
ncbi:MAG: SRPBCC family protein [Comamonadaceae bacterium]|nr:SRPBCC family protein [Comamonadaceae bacterium]